MALCADCSMHKPSSILSIVAPRLPWLPGSKGEFTNPSYLFSRSPYQLQHVNTSKVSVSAVSHLTDVCRCRFDTATSTAGSIDLMEHLETFGGGCMVLVHIR